MKDFMKNLKNKLKKKAGFTLVELMVVVAIIGVLIAVAVPLYSGSQDSAKDAVGQANERSAKALAAAKDMVQPTESGEYYFDAGTGTLVKEAGNKTYTVTVSDEDGAVVTVTPDPKNLFT